MLVGIGIRNPHLGSNGSVLSMRTPLRTSSSKAWKCLKVWVPSTSHERTTSTIFRPWSLHRPRKNLTYTVRCVLSFERNVLHFQSIKFLGWIFKKSRESCKSDPTSDVILPDGQIRPAVGTKPKTAAHSFGHRAHAASISFCTSKGAYVCSHSQFKEMSLNKQ